MGTEGECLSQLTLSDIVAVVVCESEAMKEDSEGMRIKSNGQGSISRIQMIICRVDEELSLAERT